MRVTKKDIAEYVGVSRSAVSLVLNNSPSSTISQKTREKILQAAKELGYVGPEIHRKLCFVLYGRNPDDPRYMYDLKIVENAASRLGYSLIFMNIKADPQDHKKLSKFIQSKEAEGDVVTGDLDEGGIDLVLNENVPYVFYGGTERENANIVVLDHEKGACEAVKHLISFGHRRIAFFSGSLDMHVHRKNLAGYCRALEEFGIPVDKSLIQVSREEDGYELCGRMQVLGIDYTAIFCVNTVIQFGALQWLKEHGVSVPSQVSLVGYGYSELVKLSKPQLSTFLVTPAAREKVVSRLGDIIHKKDVSPQGGFLSDLECYKGGTVAAAAVHQHSPVSG